MRLIVKYYGKSYISTMQNIHSRNQLARISIEYSVRVLLRRTLTVILR